MLRALGNAAYVTLLLLFCNVYTGVLSSQVQDLIANCFCISLCRSAETSFKICLPYMVVPWRHNIWCLHSITQCCCVLCSHFCTCSRFLIISILLTQWLSGIMQEIIKCMIRPGCDDVIHWWLNFTIVICIDMHGLIAAEQLKQYWRNKYYAGCFIAYISFAVAPRD